LNENKNLITQFHLLKSIH